MESILKDSKQRTLEDSKPGEQSGGDVPGDGLAWVRDGKVFVSDPRGTGRPASVEPCSGVELYVNGTNRVEPIPVLSSDQIVTIPLEQAAEGRFRVDLSDDRMEAYLDVEPTRVLTHQLYDQEPQNRLTLKTFARETLSCPFDFSQFRKTLAEAGVVSGIDYSAVLRIIQKPERARVVVARGKPPGLPVDEKVEILFPQEVKPVPLVRDDGTVDFHNVKKMFFVEAGELLAVVSPGTPGTPGVDVCGREILPLPPRRAVVRTGKGARLVEEEGRVYAGRTGRPVLRQSGRVYFIDVEDVMVHHGDVDLRTGNIRFRGTLLVVRGNVLESMEVRSIGMTIIDGVVSGARVATGDHLRINGNVINSTVSAGTAKELLDRIVDRVGSLEKGLRKVKDIVGLLSKQEKVQAAGLNYGYIVRVVIEKKMTELPKTLEIINSMCREEFLYPPEEVERTILKVGRVLSDPHRLANEEDISILLKEIEIVQQYFKGLSEHKADVDLAGAVNSRICATGNVNIREIGCFNSTIHAGGSVRIDSVFRGGRIFAGGSVEINEAGTETGASSVIEVEKNNKVKIQHCYEGVTIVVGRRVGRVIGEARNLTAGLGDSGDLQMDFFKA